MARRPSTVSLSSVGSGSGLSKLAQLPPLPGLPSRGSKALSNGSPPVSRKASLNTPQVNVTKNGDAWDPDDLFTKHTVAEVKAIQQRLRADADAKQEELRLMVGERYRDLLQASTSIISLAQSSDRVLHALNDMRNVTSSVQTVESPKLAGSGQGDTHLQSMQSLAAHLKLLLDSPEHLWRLMEKKMYLHAAWLFLLSRVVHRSLLRHEADEDDEGWTALGIDITEQFPLVQRQWEAISQFRSQITHKSTLALREPSLTSPEVCAILLALHLLESRPFAEALHTFLAQRNRCLSTALLRHKDRLPNGYGSAPEVPSSPAGTLDHRSRKAETRDVRQRSKAVLEVVSKTLGSARTVFLGEADQPPLMRSVIAHIQASEPLSHEDLPSEVRLTSQTLLASLPSSNHFLLLPTTIRGYKPYVDADSLSLEKRTRFSKSLADWFENAMQNIRTAISSWVADLTTISELWETRAWCRKWIRTSRGLQADEKASVNAAVDTICRARAIEIWETVLTSIDLSFHEHLGSALTELGQPSGADTLDSQPARYLLQAPSISFSSHSRESASIPFQQYSHGLQQQISGRTPLMQGVLNTIETRIQVLRSDLDTMRGQDEDTQTLASELVEHYRNDADSMCKSLCNTMQAALDGLQAMSASTLRQMVFVARLADELSSSARLLTRIGCSAPATNEFRERLQAIHEDIMHQWQDYIVAKTVDEYWSHVSCAAGTDKALHASEQTVHRPSATAVSSILSLATAVQQLGSLLDPSRSNKRTQQLLKNFADRFIKCSQENSGSSSKDSVEVAKDLVFLHILVTAWKFEAGSIAECLREAATDVLSSQNQDFDAVRDGMMGTVSKMQLLFGLLLPSTPFTEQSRLGETSKPRSPLVEPQYQSAVELVKPSARFGLLLVGSSLTR